jgi:phosphate starvation-inducible PhoH-like protein
MDCPALSDTGSHLPRMSTTTITLSNPDEVRTLFGTQDAHLRRIRDAVGVNIVLRGEGLVLEGTEEQLRRGRDVIDQLAVIVDRTGELSEADVGRVLDGVVPAPVPVEAAIDLFEKAKRVQPRTRGQAEYVEAMRAHDLVFCRGPAGCGKTYLAVAMAVNAFRRELVRKIVLVRPAVEAGEKLGFLPGDLLAKVNPFLRPLLDAMNEMLEFDQVKRYMEADIIEIVPLAFMRGRTLNQTFIILDEAQNTTITQMKMFLTRMGEASKIVATGDVTQVDLPANVPSGLIDAIGRLESIDGVAVVDLTARDIVRHRLVRDIVRAYEVDGRKSVRLRRN